VATTVEERVEYDDKRWLRLRSYIDGAEKIEIVLAQLRDLTVELEDLHQAGYVLDRPVEADGICLARPVLARAYLTDGEPAELAF
jgi:hypothetical protein